MSGREVCEGPHSGRVRQDIELEPGVWTRAWAIRVPCASEDAVLKPLAIDLFAGLGGWTSGLLAEGYDVIGFDIEIHRYGDMRYPAQLVVQDVLTLHGSQFKDAALIVCSPPCQEYSYMAMPWTLAKAKAAIIRADETGQALADLNRLFNACFRIQKEASMAAGRHIPMVVENVRGAIPWVGRSRWAYGSFHLWGDVPALMPITKMYGLSDSVKRTGRTMCYPAGSANPDAVKGRTGKLHWQDDGIKAPGMNWSDQTKRGQDFTRIAGQHAANGVKAAPDGLGGYGGSFGWDDSPMRRGNSKSPTRKAASAIIAKIPFPLSSHIARAWHPSKGSML